MASKQVWCDKCGVEKKLHEKPTVVLAIGRTLPTEEDPGEPGEYARYMRGTLKRTSDELRTTKIYSQEGENAPLELVDVSIMMHHVCDWCMRTLMPGDTVWCVTYWLEIHPDPELWEADYLEEVSR